MIQGITITDIYDPRLEYKLSRLQGPRRYARIVIDDQASIAPAASVIEMARRYVEPVIQIQDSYGDRHLSDDDLYYKAQTIFDVLYKYCSFWEIGNEVNGDWCSPNIAERVVTTYALMPENSKALLTLFYDPTGGDMDWYRKNPIKSHYVGFSFYPHSTSEIMNNKLEERTKEVLEINPEAKVILSEYGLEEWSDKNLSWRKEEKALSLMNKIFVDNPAWDGSLGWWDWQGKDYSRVIDGGV